MMHFAVCPREIFESSEADEKRQLLNLVFQNLQLKDGSLSVSVREPFLTMLDFKNRPEEWGRLDAFRTFDWKNLFTHNILLPKTLTRPGNSARFPPHRTSRPTPLIQNMDERL